METKNVREQYTFLNDVFGKYTLISELPSNSQSLEAAFLGANDEIPQSNGQHLVLSEPN
jgi:hypothetical protein